MKDLTEGRIVHYVMLNGEHRPAFVVRVWRKLEQVDPTLDPFVSQEFREVPPDNGCCQLQVFTDGSNDVPCNQPYIDQMKTLHGIDPKEVAHGHFWKTSVLFSEEPKPNTWHWIERA